LTFYRFGFFLIFVLVGRAICIKVGFTPLVATMISAGGGIFFLAFEYFVSTRRAKDVLAFFFGLSMAILVSNACAFVLSQLPILKGIRFWIYLFFNLVGIYLFGTFSYSKREELRFLNMFFLPPRRQTSNRKLLDTSVIIDGRILGIARSGFLEGEIIVPRFILRELQRIADSKDHMRRTKGRRGLDVLKEMQGLDGFRLLISGEDIPGIKEVDQKLIELAKRKKASIVTTDFNLKKLADIHNVKVLNVNELSKELKPFIMAGDTIKVKIIKPGKETGQGVGYLEDGTMVVVEEGIRYLNKELNCVVESVLQTEAGRMVFAKIADFPEEESVEEFTSGSEEPQE